MAIIYVRNRLEKALNRMRLARYKIAAQVGMAPNILSEIVTGRRIATDAEEEALEKFLNVDRKFLFPQQHEE